MTTRRGGEFERFFLVMGDEDRRVAGLVVQLAQPETQLFGPFASSAPNGSSGDRTRGSIASARASATPDTRHPRADSVARLESTQLYEIGSFLAATLYFVARRRSRRLRTRGPKVSLSSTRMCLNSAYCWNTKPTRRSCTDRRVASMSPKGCVHDRSARASDRAQQRRLARPRTDRAARAVRPTRSRGSPRRSRRRRRSSCTNCVSKCSCRFQQPFIANLPSRRANTQPIRPVRRFTLHSVDAIRSA